jgi:hypothetical protein
MPKPKFQTDRMRTLQAGKLNKYEEETIDRIQEFGCSLLSVVRKNAERAEFSYSIGVYDTCGAPELITVGLHPGVARELLNEAINRMRSGIDLTVERQAGLIGNVDCEFRPVDPKWIAPFMLSSVWYNGNADFPVLQAIYPDLQNRFPGEEGFNEYFAQPLLQPDAPMTRLEDDFWAANDPKSSLFDWKFKDDPHTLTYLSQTVHEGSEEVTYVAHDIEDGAWQFLGDSMSEGGGPVLVCLHHPIDKDPTLKELANLPLGWYAERTKVGDPWIRKEQEADEPPSKAVVN